MDQQSDHLAEYLEARDARLRSQPGKATAEDDELDRHILPAEIGDFCRDQPSQCLQLIIDALQRTNTPEHVAAIGDELLEDLLNENSARIAADVLRELQTNSNSVLPRRRNERVCARVRSNST